MSNPYVISKTTLQFNEGSEQIPEGRFNPQCFMKRNHFPTTVEKDFFFRNVVISNKDLPIKNMNDAFVELPALRMRILNLAENGIMRLIHSANLFDILIRLVIQKSGGNLNDTRYTIK